MTTWVVSGIPGFAVAVIVIVAIPGPSVLFTISRAFDRGAASDADHGSGQRGRPFAAGGRRRVRDGRAGETSALFYTVVKYVGAAYIVHLGVQATRHRRSMAEALSRQLAAVTPRRAARDGFVVGTTNPKTLVILVTVMPRFADPTAGNLPLQLLLLGALFPIVALVLDSIWAFLAGTARHWFVRSPKRMAAIGGSGGLVMIGTGVNLALTGRND